MQPERIAPERIELSRNTQRYELAIDGEVASFASFHERGDTIVFPHTVTLPEFRGNQLAEQVVRFALDDVRQRGKRIVATCSFVAEFVERNPEYADLVEGPR